MTQPARFAAAAEALVGTPFRLHGRDPATGLDCVGLAASALAATGRLVITPEGYRLRNTGIDAYLEFAAGNGLAPVVSPVRRGDLLLVRPGPAQVHLLVATGAAGFVHAHAGLGRVVASPGRSPWPLLHHFRLLPQSED